MTLKANDRNLLGNMFHGFANDGPANGTKWTVYMILKAASSCSWLYCILECWSLTLILTKWHKVHSPFVPESWLIYQCTSLAPVLSLQALCYGKCLNCHQYQEYSIMPQWFPGMTHSICMTSVQGLLQVYLPRLPALFPFWWEWRISCPVSKNLAGS